MWHGIVVGRNISQKVHSTKFSSGSGQDLELNLAQITSLATMNSADDVPIFAARRSRPFRQSAESRNSMSRETLTLESCTSGLPGRGQRDRPRRVHSLERRDRQYEKREVKYRKVD